MIKTLIGLLVFLIICAAGASIFMALGIKKYLIGRAKKKAVEQALMRIKVHCGSNALNLLQIVCVTMERCVGRTTDEKLLEKHQLLKEIRLSMNDYKGSPSLSDYHEKLKKSSSRELWDNIVSNAEKLEAIAKDILDEKNPAYKKIYQALEEALRCHDFFRSTAKGLHSHDETLDSFFNYLIECFPDYIQRYYPTQNLAAELSALLDAELRGCPPAIPPARANALID